VDVFVAVYGLGISIGAEMISYNNLLYADERGSLPEQRLLAIDLGDQRKLRVREVVVPAAGDSWLVWTWFMVGDRSMVNEFAVKAYESLAFVTRSADSERIVTLATHMDGDARGRLHAFVKAQGSCIATGFAAEACRE